MAAPVFIAVNQTGSDVVLDDLRLTVPASGQVNLSTFNPTWRIQSDAQLLGLINDDTLLLNDGSTTLTKVASIQYVQPVASSVPIAQEATTTTAGYMSAADKVALDKTALAQIVRVAISGGDFQSIKAAVDSITDASATKPYVVEVAPGVYSEDPFTIPAYVNVYGKGTWVECVIETTNNSAHFISLAAGATLAYAAVTGPTGSGYAAINYEGTGYTPAFLYHVTIRKGHYGVYVHPASYGTIHCHEVVNQYKGSQINQFFRVTNGNATLMTCSYMSGPSASVVTGYYAAGAGVTLTLDNCAFRCAGSTDALFADDGASIRLTATSLSDGTNAVHVGSTGTGTHVVAEACAIGDSFTKDIWIESGSAVVSYNGSAHLDKVAVASGCILTGLISDNSVDAPNITAFGKFYTGAEANELFPLSTFTAAYKTTGVFEGGGLERVSGLQVKVLAGRGLATDGAGLLKEVTWVDTTLTLTASQEQLYMTVDDTGLVDFSASPPDLTRKLFMGRASTSGSAVVFLSSGQVDIPQPAQRLWEYTTEVIGPISFTGGAVTQHADPGLELTVTGGEFYAHNVEKMFTGGDPVTFTYWYRATPSGWVAVGSQTEIDTAHYDDGSGALVHVGTDKYKRDVLYVTTNSSGTEYHVVYGQTLFDSAVEATSNPTPPTFLNDSSCRLAAIVVLKDATDIASLVDQRPKLGQMAAASAGVTRHGDLSGLSNNDHPQYQLISAKDAASGYAGLDATSKINSSALPTHKSNHEISGSDTVDHNNLTNYSANKHVDHTAVSISTSSGLQGGGDISANRTLSPVYGSALNTVCQGNDARLSDARTPTSHASTHNAGGGDALAIDAVAGTGSLRTLGTAATAACAGNDSRLSDDRTASGIRTATTVVACSTATAPVAKQSLVATSGTAATWQSIYTVGGEAGGAARALGNTDAYDLTFITNNLTRLTITSGGNVTAAGRLAGNTLVQGPTPETSVQNVTSGQSVITGYYGLQLVGNKQSTVEYTPANIGAAGDYGVVIPNQQLASTALMIRGAASQSGDLQEWQNSAGAHLLAVSADGSLRFQGKSTNPATPTAESTAFSKLRAGRCMMSQVGPSGADYSFQPSLFGNKFAWWTARGNGSSTSTINFSSSTTGSSTTRNVATSGFFASLRRVGYQSASSPGSSAGVRHDMAQFWRGNATGYGGFFVVIRFGVSQTQTQYRWFVGMSSTTGSLSNAQPSTFTDQFGVGQDGTDTNIQFMHNDGSGSCTKVDLGASFPRPTANTEFYELRLFCAPNGDTIYYSLEKMDPAASAVVEGSVTTNIPTSTTLLTPQVWINNNAQAAVVTIDVSSIYVETDN